MIRSTRCWIARTAALLAFLLVARPFAVNAMSVILVPGTGTVHYSSGSRKAIDGSQILPSRFRNHRGRQRMEQARSMKALVKLAIRCEPDPRFSFIQSEASTLIASAAAPPDHPPA